MCISLKGIFLKPTILRFLMLRTHTCGELRKQNSGSEVTLAGWVDTVRALGKKTFLDLRDKYGKTQVLLDESTKGFEQELRRETCVQVIGKVVEKPKANPNLETGEVEVVATKLIILGAAKPLPFDEETATEETRMKYRYLDLRSEKMQEHIQFRSNVAMAARNHLVQKGFVEIETPLLVRSTPEGARDFLVPSRVNKGKFYALPQSPQIYKQLLMLANFDKYFQLGKCLRDEDLRADRQPEHTQIDVEMSFVEPEDVYKVGEDLIAQIVQETVGKKISTPIKRLAYNDAMEKYGIDKPDLRFGMELTTVTDFAHKTDFKVFNSAKAVRALVAPALYSKKEIEALTKFVAQYNAKGLAFMSCEKDELAGPIAKFFSADQQKELKALLAIEDGQTAFFVADSLAICNEALAQLRNKLGADLGLYGPDELEFCWITDFPLFEWDEEAQDYIAAHHMFTMPSKDTIEFLETDKSKVFADCYDLVLNGVELSSGSIRNHDPKLQSRVMNAMGLDANAVKEKFGFFLDALEYGAPPHGGFAIGIDRLCAVLRNRHDIREFIAFPKNKQMQSSMDGSPTPIEDTQIEELGIKKK